jgi:RNA polymerase sigma-70 factor (ECF subfamily)
MQPGPVVAMNKAIASAYLSGRKKALQELQAIKGLENHHLYYASIGEMYFEMQERGLAKEYFEKAMRLTNSEAEKKLLREKIDCTVGYRKELE